jgi:hypothetical protein
MNETSTCICRHTGNPSRGGTAWNACIALGIGALAGALVAAPYERLIGVPDSACAILRSVVSLAALGGLGAGRTRGLLYRTVETPEPTLGSFAQGREAKERLRQTALAGRLLMWQRRLPCT